MNKLLENFRPRPPWWGGDLQTVRNAVVKPQYELRRWPHERLKIALPDGDRLVGELHRGEELGRPLVILLHGLAGCAESTYIRASAQALLTEGWSVLRLNLRGAGPSGPLCSSSYHSGRSEDLRQALAALRAERPSLVQAGVLALGFSLGGNLLLKFVAEGEFPVPLHAASVVSTPIDLDAAERRLARHRNRFYLRFLLQNMRAEIERRTGEAAREALRALAEVRSIREFDERITAPFNGFTGAEDYYLRNSALPLLGAIRVPTLIVQAADDPWIPVDSYRAVAWSQNPFLRPLLLASGGHVGFHGLGSRFAWHDRALLEFFAAEGAYGPSPAALEAAE